MWLDRPLDGVTNPKHKLLHFLTTKFFCKENKALAFNRDRCCHLVLCLQLILFHCIVCDKKRTTTGTNFPRLIAKNFANVNAA